MSIYLHSALTNGRVPVRDERELLLQVLRFAHLDVIVALGLAEIVNMAMLAVAAKLFHYNDRLGVSTIERAHGGFATMVGGGAAFAFSMRAARLPRGRPPRASAPTPVRS